LCADAMCATPGSVAAATTPITRGRQPAEEQACAAGESKRYGVSCCREQPPVPHDPTIAWARVREPVGAFWRPTEHRVWLLSPERSAVEVRR